MGPLCGPEEGLIQLLNEFAKAGTAAFSFVVAFETGASDQ